MPPPTMTMAGPPPDDDDDMPTLADAIWPAIDGMKAAAEDEGAHAATMFALATACAMLPDAISIAAEQGGPNAALRKAAADCIDAMNRTSADIAELLESVSAQPDRAEALNGIAGAYRHTARLLAAIATLAEQTAGAFALESAANRYTPKN